MADGKTHSKTFFKYTLIPFILLLIYCKMYLFIPLLIISNMICDSDEDTKWKGAFHRHVTTHSVILAVIIVSSFAITLLEYIPLDILFEWATKAVMVCSLPIMVHLALDIPASKHKIKDANGDYIKKKGKYVYKRGQRVGSYRISFYPFRGHLNGFMTVVWLVVNIASILCIWCIFIFL